MNKYGLLIAIRGHRTEHPNARQETPLHFNFVVKPADSHKAVSARPRSDTKSSYVPLQGNTGGLGNIPRPEAVFVKPMASSSYAQQFS